MIKDSPVQYVGVDRVEDPLVFVPGVHGVGYAETAEVTDNEGKTRPATVLEVDGDRAVIQVLGGAIGLSNTGTRVRFLGGPLSVRVSEDMLGRAFDGLGRPIDGGPAPLGGQLRDAVGIPINPAARAYPTDFIQTGISVIDGSNSLIRGQKLPIFSGSGMPHSQIAAQIVRQATLPGREEKESFAVILAGMGIKNDEAEFFRHSFEAAGVLSRVALFLSPADSPSVERMQTPRTALTLAEYLAFDRGMHVLVVLTDMTNFCDALREVSSARDEIPARKAAEIGLILECVPDAELDTHALALAKRMAQVPTSQLVMLKLLCNQTVENMGFASSRTLGTLFDGIARHTQEGLDFVARAQDVGFRQAVRERDEPFGDYGSRPRNEKP